MIVNIKIKSNDAESVSIKNVILFTTKFKDLYVYYLHQIY